MIIAVTPEEASLKGCPVGMKIPQVICCIGPRCMAWSWFNYREKQNTPDTGYCGMVTSHVTGPINGPWEATK